MRMPAHWRRAIVMGTALLAAVAAGCQRREPAPPPDPVERPGPSATFEGEASGVRLRLDDDQGRPLYEVRSDSSQQSQAGDQASVTLTDTRVTLYHEGRPDIVVEAPKAEVRSETGELVMWGGLSAEAVREGATLRMDRLTWSHRTRAFAGEGEVVFTRPPVVMRADRITGVTPVKTVELDGGVTVTVNPKRDNGNG